MKEKKEEELPSVCLVIGTGNVSRSRLQEAGHLMAVFSVTTTSVSWFADQCPLFSPILSALFFPNHRWQLPTTDWITQVCGTA